MSKSMTIETAATKFGEHLTTLGKKPSTIGTAGRVLKRMSEFFGADKAVASLRPADVGRFFKSDAVLKVDGKPSAEPTILQNRRIARQFLIWCHEQGWVKTSPVPKDEAALGGVSAAQKKAAGE